MSDTLTPSDPVVLAHDSLLIPPGMRSQCGRLRIVRVCAVRVDGTLISPHQLTPWTGLVMRSHTWSDSRAVLGQCGLHGVWDRWPDIRPDRIGQAVVRVLGDGRAVVSPWACRVERMAVQEIVLHPEASDDTLAVVRRRYPEVMVRRARASRAKRRRCVRMYSTGEVVVERYRDGLKHGRWETWDPAGHRTIVHYRADRLHGRRVETRNGCRLVQHFRLGQRHGRWEAWDPAGHLTIVHYRDDRPHGMWMETRPDDGYRLVQRYRCGRRHGRWEEVWVDVRRVVSYYRDDRPHGQWVETRPDGYRCVQRFLLGLRHGRWEEAWPDGRRIVSHYRDDLLHGRREEYMPDGRVVVSHYRAGVRIS